MTPAAANERKPRARTGRPNGSRAPAERARPKALAIPKAKRDEYLDRVANGEDRAVVANDLGCTGRLFRSLARNAGSTRRSPKARNPTPTSTPRSCARHAGTSP